MDADLLSLFEDGLERFNRERYAPAQLLQRVHQGEAGTPAALADMAALGWFELLNDDRGVPARAITPLLPLFRAAGEGLWQEPLHTVLGASAVIAARCEHAELRARLLDGLIDGTQPLVYASREAGDGWTVTAPRTQASLRDGRVFLRGEKTALADAATCTGAVVRAQRPDQTGTAFYRVLRDAPGVHWRCARGIDGRSLGTLELHDAPADFLCDGQQAARAEAWAAILAAAESVGLMHGAIGDTAAYLRERKQFGRALIEFQALQHRLVECHLLERETEALLHTVAAAFDEDGTGRNPRAALALRAQASRALRQVTAEAVQLHGGMGVTHETRVSHAYRRALAIDAQFGSEAWALEQLA